MLGVPLGLIYANAGEWLIHKHLLHGKRHGRVKGTFWSFHWHEHHRNARRYNNYDPTYQRSLWGWHAQSKEALGLAGIALLHLPLFAVTPFFAGTVLYSVVHYHRVHKRAHQDPEWARQHLPWHVDHHLGPDQDANWCVSRPWCDILMGTRKPYVGTEREAHDRRRRPKRRQARASSLRPRF